MTKHALYRETTKYLQCVCGDRFDNKEVFNVHKALGMDDVHLSNPAHEALARLEDLEQYP